MDRPQDLLKVAVEVRRARSGDEPAILRCLREAFAPYREQYTPGAYADTVVNEAGLGERIKTMRVIVAVSNGEIVGTVAGAESPRGEGHLRGMAVLPQYLGTGVSAQLLAAIEAWFKIRGCTRVTLDTTQPLQAAMRFYEKHGYCRSGVVSDFFGMPLIEYVKPMANPL